jgi:hypothetical protein
MLEFDMRALRDALDGERRARRLTWDQLAAEINEPFKHTPSIPISVGDQDHDDEALRHQRCRASGPALASPHAGKLPCGTRSRARAGRGAAGSGTWQILGFDTAAIHAALDAKRREQGMTWSEVARALPGFTPSMLTNLAKGPLIGFPRVMALTQWLGRPASEFVRARSK